MKQRQREAHGNHRPHLPQEVVSVPYFGEDYYETAEQLTIDHFTADTVDRIVEAAKPLIDIADLHDGYDWSGEGWSGWTLTAVRLKHLRDLREAVRSL